jgi:hypothetical protein
VAGFGRRTHAADTSEAVSITRALADYEAVAGGRW